MVAVHRRRLVRHDGELRAVRDEETVIASRPAVGLVRVLAPHELGLGGVGEVEHHDAAVPVAAGDIVAEGVSLVNPGAVSDDLGVPAGRLAILLALEPAETDELGRPGVLHVVDEEHLSLVAIPEPRAVHQLSLAVVDRAVDAEPVHLDIVDEFGVHGVGVVEDAQPADDLGFVLETGPDLAVRYENLVVDPEHLVRTGGGAVHYLVKDLRIRRVLHVENRHAVVAVHPGGRHIAEPAAHLDLKRVAPPVQVGVGDQPDVAALLGPGLGERMIDADISLRPPAPDRIRIVIRSGH